MSDDECESNKVKFEIAMRGPGKFIEFEPIGTGKEIFFKSVQSANADSERAEKRREDIGKGECRFVESANIKPLTLQQSGCGEKVFIGAVECNDSVVGSTTTLVACKMGAGNTKPDPKSCLKQDIVQPFLEASSATTTNTEGVK